MMLIGFWLIVLCYFVTDAMLQVIIFDDDPSFNLYGNETINEYHVYRGLKRVLLFLVAAFAPVVGINIFYLLGMFIVSDFIYERTYNLYFKRWMSPHPFKIGKLTIVRKWWFPLAKLALGMVLIWLFS